MINFDRKKYPIYASFLNQLAKDLTKFYNSDNAAHRNVKLIHKGFVNSSADEIIEFGLHEFLTKFIDDMSITYSDLENIYFLGTDK